MGKTDKGGKATFVGPLIIRATVDSYGGNSGSPIFDSNGLLAGILVGGSTDFTDSHSCEASNFCPGGKGCEQLGEYIVPICVLITSSEDVNAEIGIDCAVEESSTIFTYNLDSFLYTSDSSLTIHSPFLFIAFIVMVFA